MNQRRKRIWSFWVSSAIIYMSCVGNSKTLCQSILNSLLDTLGQSSIKNRDTDIMNYTYTTVGYPNKRNTSGGGAFGCCWNVDYLGVIQIYTVTKESSVDYLCHSLQEGCLDSVGCFENASPVDFFPYRSWLSRNTYHYYADSEGSRHCRDSLLVDRCDYQDCEWIDKREFRSRTED